MPLLQIDVTIQTETALSVGAGGSAGSLADKSIVRDGWGRPIIPGSQLKGKARHAAEAILCQLGQPVPTHFDDDKTDTLIRAIFGSPGHSSPLRFADLVGAPVGAPNELPPADDPWPLARIRPSVSINRRRGMAEDARLLFQEAAIEGLVYAASPAIRGEIDTLGQAALLWAALRLTTRWGGAKSRGLGWAVVTVGVRWDGQVQADDALENALREVIVPR